MQSSQDWAAIAQAVLTLLNGIVMAWIGRQIKPGKTVNKD